MLKLKVFSSIVSCLGDNLLYMRWRILKYNLDIPAGYYGKVIIDIVSGEVKFINHDKKQQLINGKTEDIPDVKISEVCNEKKWLIRVWKMAHTGRL